MSHRYEGAGLLTSLHFVEAVEPVRVCNKKPERLAPALRTQGDKLKLAAQFATKQPCEA